MHVTGAARQKTYLLFQHYAQYFLMPIIYAPNYASMIGLGYAWAKWQYLGVAKNALKVLFLQAYNYYLSIQQILVASYYIIYY